MIAGPWVCLTCPDRLRLFGALFRTICMSSFDGLSEGGDPVA